MGAPAAYINGGEGLLISSNFSANENTLRVLSHNGVNTAFIVKANGKVGIGTTFSGTLPTDFNEYRLFVKDGIRTEKVKVDLATTGWGDNVFLPNYRLRPIAEIDSFIQANQHLPDVPSEKELHEKGLDLAEMHRVQMVKIEELTLYLIEQDKKIKQLEAEITKLQNRQ